MKLTSTIFLIGLFFIASAQKGEATFQVQKPAKESRIDLDLFHGMDTLPVNSGFMFDYSKIAGKYDSIGVFNLEVQKMDKTHWVVKTSHYEGIGMIKFFRKNENGKYNLIYIKNFVIRKI